LSYEKNKLTQTDVGKLVGLKQQTISEFENNPEGTKLSTLFRILSAIKLELYLSEKNKPLKSAWKEEW